MNDVPAHGARERLPSEIARLHELAYNLWWSWQPEAVELFRSIDPGTWDATGHNPILVLDRVQGARLRILADDTRFVALYANVLERFDAYMNLAKPTWFARTYPHDQRLIAYFCAEFGLHESLPIYSGGLGVLAGDHCKTASDLGLPFVAVGLWYTQGYFHQRLDAHGQQIAEPESLQPAIAPLQATGPEGTDLTVEVEMAGRTVYARVWRLQVGRVPIYLLDTDLPQNTERDRALCARLYGGDRETRIAQEMLLGIGGVRALRALNLNPTRWHMNEGHAAFLGLERIREKVQSGIDFIQAWPNEAEATIFTTHTPVPAGNEVFKEELAARYLADLPARLGLDLPGMLALAREEGVPPGTFAMTPLALRLSHRANGVSKLHGAVARRMWHKQFPDCELEEVPITSVTNGVHTGTWIAPALRELFDRYLGADWLERVDDPVLWQGIDKIPDEELWNIHNDLKTTLFAAARQRAVGPMTSQVAMLNPDVLTIGFARRFATYKRATLFFHDPERARRILSDARRPVQLLYAGKAHPADAGGQGFIKSIFSMAEEPAFAGKVIFLEGYDIGLARSLVQGVDLWLNNPERPQEASGTSGQKAALNGVPNCSIRDGWWDEGYNGRNGWAFGGEVGDDDIDSDQLYEVLQKQILPSYYERDARNLPTRWLAVMRESIRTLAPAFSAQRMVKEYTERLYS